MPDLLVKKSLFQDTKRTSTIHGLLHHGYIFLPPETCDLARVDIWKRVGDKKLTKFRLCSDDWLVAP